MYGITCKNQTLDILVVLNSVQAVLLTAELAH